jgi:hypothetical protein
MDLSSQASLTELLRDEASVAHPTSLRPMPHLSLQGHTAHSSLTMISAFVPAEQLQQPDLAQMAQPTLARPPTSDNPSNYYGAYTSLYHTLQPEHIIALEEAILTYGFVNFEPKEPSPDFAAARAKRIVSLELLVCT